MQQNKKRIYRPVNGILILDKPLHLSSNHALQAARRIFAAKKAGHGGSLDVLASGLLPVFFGEATKFSQYMLGADKHYYVIAKLGIKTSTGDAEGEIISQSDSVNISLETFESVLNEFLGETKQIPSMYSALKFQGTPLYKLARQGIEVERQARDIHIKQIKLINFENNEATLEVHCSKGTYIRNLVEDIGEKLGCGAYVKCLRRLSAGHFIESQMVTLETLKQSFENNGFEQLDSYLMSMDSVLQDYPAIHLTQDQVKKLLFGQMLTECGDYSPNLYRAYDEQSQFVGLVEIKPDKIVYAKRLLATHQD